MTIQLALECPVPFLKDLIPQTDFDFVLTHLVLSQPEYRDFYLGQRKLSNRVMILDNSTNELGEPCSLEDIDKAACILDPDFVIPPDYLGDGYRTLTSISKGEAIWGRKKIIPVIQGSSLTEIMECYCALRDLDYSKVAVPYDIGLSRSVLKTTSLEYLGMNRNYYIQRMVSECGDLTDKDLHIHLLGLNSLTEVQFYTRNCPEVEGLDTGAPFLNASAGLEFSKDSLMGKGVFINYNLKYGPKEFSHIKNLACKNIHYLESLIGG